MPDKMTEGGRVCPFLESLLRGATSVFAILDRCSLQVSVLGKPFEGCDADVLGNLTTH